MENHEDQNGSVTQRINRISDGESGAPQADLFNRYYHAVVHKAKHKLSRLSVVDASDVAASVWGTIFRGIAEGQYRCADRAEFEELLGKITYYKAINLYKWVHRKKRMPTQDLSEHDTYKLIENTLPENCRSVAEMYYLGGFTVEAIAVQLAISVDSVNAALHATRKAIKTQVRLRTADSSILENIPSGTGPLETLMLEELLDSLDEKLRETVLLKLRGLTTTEISNALDISERQVRRRLKLVKKTLESQLSET